LRVRAEIALGNGSSGTRAVTDGTHTADIRLLGNYTASSFVAASDDRGGTLVHDPKPSLVLFRTVGSELPRRQPERAARPCDTAFVSAHPLLASYPV